MLDDVEINEEKLADQSDFSVTRNHQTWDHLSALEVAHLEPGKYKLLIAIPKGHWFSQRSITTCLRLDVMMEFIQKDGGKNAIEDSFVNDSSGPVEIMSIFPPSKDNLQIGEVLSIMMHFSRKVDFREVASKLTDLSTMCRL